MKNVSGLPTSPPRLSPKARLKPTTTHSRLMTPSATKLWSIVETTFFKRTMPPSKNDRPGVINRTRPVAVNIQATSPEEAGPPAWDRRHGSGKQRGKRDGRQQDEGCEADIHEGTSRAEHAPSGL